MSPVLVTQWTEHISVSGLADSVGGANTYLRNWEIHRMQLVSFS